eukprot:GGOE01065153.1.p3 GENE.GGOE01065153.1~~GGOE01065153.1.p3  ORF type:complete len:140 (+),score=49.75 GGOE01065153.1:72-491(+)
MAAAKEPELTDSEVLERYNELRQEYGAVAQKISEIEMDRNEHALVMEALRTLEAERKCYRLVGGVLVERTAAEVRPAIEKSIEGMEQILKRLNSALQAKEKDIADHVAKYNVKFMGNRDIRGDKAVEEAASKPKAGVLA